MSGIIFYKTTQLENVLKFYIEKLDCSLWMDQKVCKILRHGNLMLGFCQSDRAETEAMITFFYNSILNVDTMYEKLKKDAVCKPKRNRKFNIYQFFARDPEGRAIELQTFINPIRSYLTVNEILLQRRSIRDYLDSNIPENTWRELIDTCRFSPSSRNSQAYYFKRIDDPKTRKHIAAIRGKSSEPIAKAPLAVAVCADPKRTVRPEQDSCIAAYHFMLAAWDLGLGSCWIADMNRGEVKNLLDIPHDHFIATVTPLGFPSETIPDPPNRHPSQNFER